MASELETEPIDWGKKRSKKKAPDAIQSPPDPLPQDTDYRYEELLARLYGQLKASDRPPTNAKLPLPALGRMGKRTCLSNFGEICRSLDRSPEHVLSYFAVELSAGCSLDGEGEQLAIRGIYRQAQIERMIKHYVRDYVACKTCKSCATVLEKADRILYLKCLSCHTRAAVPQIRAGFQARVSKTV